MATPRSKTQRREFLVRIRPDPNRPSKRYTVFGIRFQEDRGWYRVDPHVAEYVQHVHMNPEDPTSPLMFDVCTEDQAKAIDRREEEAKLRQGKASAMQPLQTVSSARDVTAAADARAGAPQRATRPPVQQIDGGDLSHEDLAAGTTRAKPKATPARGGRAMRAIAE